MTDTCRHDHLLTPENIRINSRGHRVCKECSRVANRKSKRQQRGRKKCANELCDRWASSPTKDYCGRCELRVQRHGDPNVVLPKQGRRPDYPERLERFATRLDPTFLEPVDFDWAWQKKARCGGAHQLFFDSIAPDTTKARALCSGCPVRRECLEFALRYTEQDGSEATGIWAGFTRSERHMVRDLRRRAA